MNSSVLVPLAQLIVVLLSAVNSCTPIWNDYSAKIIIEGATQSGLTFVNCPMHRLSILLLLLVSATLYGQKYSLQYVENKTNASFRGISVADKHAIWVSGSKGWVGRNANGGKDWKFRQVPGYESCDFRTLYAFDSNNAIIANAGSPAYILHTSDGGVSWKQVYKNTDTAAFIDGIDFWDKKHGLIHGDPINGRMLLLYTKDGGKTLEERNSPKMGQGEASFAASGTCISCFRHTTVVIAAGGRTSKLYLSRNRGKRWRSMSTPMLASSESTGIFSFMTGRKSSHWLVAGGDYRRDSLRTANFFYTTDKGKTWLAPESTTRGYRECLAKTDNAMFAVGPSGIDISTDDGVNWKGLSDEKGFHVIKAIRDLTCVFLAGGNGKLAIMKIVP
jgi:photosystem II stability/assembly factor-like uncharacterized protein